MFFLHTFIFFSNNNNMKKIALILFSILGGAINGLFSTGAGLVLIPALVLLLKYDSLVSRGTVLTVISILCFINIIIYSRFYEFKIETIWIIIGAVIGSIIGNIVVGKINKNVLSIIFAIFTIIMGIGLIK